MDEPLTVLEGSVNNLQQASPDSARRPGSCWPTGGLSQQSAASDRAFVIGLMLGSCSWTLDLKPQTSPKKTLEAPRLSACLPVCLSIYQSVCLRPSVCLPVSLFFRPSVRPSACPSVFSLCVNLFVGMSACLSTCACASSFVKLCSACARVSWLRQRSFLHSCIKGQ